MPRPAPLLRSAARAGALSALFGWLAVYLQAALANQLGFSFLFMAWFGLGGGLLAALLGCVLGWGTGFLFRRGLTGVALAALIPAILVAAAFALSWFDPSFGRRSEILLGPTVQALALAFVGGAFAALLLFTTSRGLRSGAIGLLAVLFAGALLGPDPDRGQHYLEPGKLAAALRPPSNPPPTLVLALDGLDGTLLDGMLVADRGRDAGDRRIPNLAALLEEGARAGFSAFQPAMTPVVWTTLATGRTWREHGVRSPNTWKVLGAARPLALRGLAAWPLLHLLSRKAPFLVGSPREVQSSDRRRRAFWEVAAQAGLRTAVIGWPVTHPALAPPGSENLKLASERAFSAAAPDLQDAVFPAEMEALAAAVLAPERNAEFEAEARAVLASVPELSSRLQETEKKFLEQGLVRFLRRVSLLLELIHRGGTDLYVLYDPLLAEAAHPERFLASAQPSPALEALRPELLAVYDNVLGTLLGSELRFGDGKTNVILLGGSGGVFLAAGPAIAPRVELEDVSPLDFVPTLLACQDLPTAQDLPGKVLEAVIRPGFLASHPPRSVETYEVPGWRP